ncbi:hypothetical protein PABY_04870 [Pyrodictium abyssi]|uniref:Uncharacterized protein n=1 Tax=Pyrodictium abyssi TaxID=54256 RepID=A0ABN6ZR99_9CREN|nr:hypothetical protein PABY_04870 [Pyrodictium abyssi]
MNQSTREKAPAKACRNAGQDPANTRHDFYVLLYGIKFNTFMYGAGSLTTPQGAEPPGFYLLGHPLPQQG